jgi:hypothetical protein
VTDRRERPRGPERQVLLERVPGELEGVADRTRCLLHRSDDGEELSCGVQSGRGGVSPAGNDRLAVDEALEQVSGRAAALRPDARLFAQVRLGGLRGDDVDRFDRRACECEPGLSRELQPHRFLGAGAPVGQ